MAHEITTGSRGEVMAMYANKPAWHNLGQVFDPGGNDAPDSATAMELANLNWRVGLEELELASDATSVKGFYGLVRQDTRECLSIVGERYQPLQNEECFAFLDSLQQDGIIRYESAMALRGGRQIVLLARMPSVDTVAEGDNQLRYVMFSSGHGGYGIEAIPTSVRVVCANTHRLALQMAKGSYGVSLRHTGSLASKLDIARKYLSQFDKEFTLYRDHARKLATGRYTPEQAREYIDQLFPALAPDATDRQQQARAGKIEEVRQHFRSPANSLPSIKGTWWQLFNAVTETVDHGHKNRRGSVERVKENKFIDTMLGDGATFKSKAFELALALAS